MVSSGTRAETFEVARSNREMGRAIPESEYGVPSKYEAHVKRRRSDVLVNKQNYSDWSMTPLHQQHGTVTPTGLIYERHHNGVPEIDPQRHRFVIHGMVRQPLEFTMSDLMKYPSVSRFYFMECSGNGLTDWLNGLSGGSIVLLGLLLGAMMAFDMGGPVNKAAYVFATTGLTAQAIAAGGTEVKIMAAVMVGGMVPPLAMALSTALRPGLYTSSERENGKAAWLLGAAFITEGAIPFAAADPLRVIPSMMLGSGVAGAISAGAGVTLAAPHGGIFVFFAVDQVLWFLVAIAVGTVVSAASVTALKQLGRGDADVVADVETAKVPAHA